jgi:DNA-binding transcriptional MerR regulator
MPTHLKPTLENLASWRGTAADLAEMANSLISLIPSLAEDAGAGNERLVRHYVQVGVLSPPDREGREALFGHRQVLEFLAARYLLRDGWPLAKVAEILRATDVAGLLELVPSDRPRTRAEAVVAEYRAAVRLSAPSKAGSFESAARLSVGSATPDRRALARSLPEPFASAAPSAAPAPSPLERAADISRRRAALEDNLKALGNRGGRPESRRLVRISLTPWCHVHIDARHLRGMTDETPGILGAALTQALVDERVRKDK